jgi:hypothetical protein
VGEMSYLYLSARPSYVDRLAAMPCSGLPMVFHLASKAAYAFLLLAASYNGRTDPRCRNKYSHSSARKQHDPPSVSHCSWRYVHGTMGEQLAKLGSLMGLHQEGTDGRLPNSGPPMPDGCKCKYWSLP